MITVVYPPGPGDPVHRHNAHAFIYVLEGAAVMQVKGGKQVTVTAGQTFYEGPDDVHVVGRSASSTKPAKLLVLLVKNKALRWWCRCHRDAPDRPTVTDSPSPEIHIHGQETMRVGQRKQSPDARISRSGMGRAGPR